MDRRACHSDRPVSDTRPLPPPAPQFSRAARDPGKRQRLGRVGRRQLVTAAVQRERRLAAAFDELQSFGVLPEGHEALTTMTRLLQEVLVARARRRRVKERMPDGTACDEKELIRDRMATNHTAEHRTQPMGVLGTGRACEVQFGELRVSKRCLGQKRGATLQIRSQPLSRQPKCRRAQPGDRLPLPLDRRKSQI